MEIQQDALNDLEGSFYLPPSFLSHLHPQTVQWYRSRGVRSNETSMFQITSCLLVGQEQLNSRIKSKV